MGTDAEQGHAIQNLKARYCATADLAAPDPGRARELFEDIFAPDVVGNYGVDPLIGRDALVEFLCTAIAGSSQWLLHAIHSPLIVVNGEYATGDWTVMVHLKRRDGGAVDVLLGRYSDSFRLTPGGWRIEKVNFTQIQ